MAREDAWQELLGKAKDGQLSVHELDQVVAAIRDPAAPGDRYTMLHIIGRAMNTSYEDLVAGFLDSPGDPMLARLALQILCSYWGKASQYLDYVRRFVRGVTWDDEGDVRQIAISVAGEYLRATWDERLFEDLLDIATDESSYPEFRQFSIEALARAMGDDWSDIPPVSTRSSPEDEWHRETLERAFEKFISAK